MPRKSTKKTPKPVRPQLGDGVEILNAGSVLEARCTSPRGPVPAAPRPRRATNRRRRRRGWRGRRSRSAAGAARAAPAVSRYAFPITSFRTSFANNSRTKVTKKREIPNRRRAARGCAAPARFPAVGRKFSRHPPGNHAGLRRKPAGSAIQGATPHPAPPASPGGRRRTSGTTR